MPRRITLVVKKPWPPGQEACRPRVVEVLMEDDDAWCAKPVENPACPALWWPKFAWEEKESTS